jgi:enoyl-CoA hydratase/carnithine racemase
MLAWNTYVWFVVVEAPDNGRKEVVVTVKVASQGPVREVTLARGEKRNALDAGMLASLTEAFARPPVAGERVTVIRAEGPAFCAGLDLRERGSGAIGSMSSSESSSGVGIWRGFTISRSSILFRC